MAKLRRLLLGIGIFYAVLAIYQTGILQSTVSPLLSTLAAITAVVSIGLWVYVNRVQPSPHRAHPIALCVAAISLVDSFAHLAIARRAEDTIYVLLIVVFAGSTFLSGRWLGLVVALALTCWGVVAWTRFPRSEWLLITFFSAALVVGSAAALVIHRIRIRERRRFHIVRLEDERRRHELQESEKRHALAVQGANDGLWYWDLATDRVSLSARWLSMLGCPGYEAHVSPKDWFDRIHPDDLNGLMIDLSAHISGRTPQFESKHRIRDVRGNYRWVLTRGLAARDEHRRATCIAGSQTDITHLVAVEQKLRHDALHDRLTGLPNRNFLTRRLQAIVDQAKRSPEQLFAVFFLDLDRFKVINDSLGHLVGDQLLTAAAKRLLTLRGPRSIISRFGGDEFVILVEDVQDRTEALAVGAKIQKVLAEPFRLGGYEVAVGASIGIVLSDGQETQPEDLLRNADVAMYNAKASDKGRIQLFDAHMHDRAIKMLRLENDLGRALERNEFRLLYQPIVSLRTGRITAVEALLRWQRPPESDSVDPSEFIPMLEEMGLIAGIGEWALKTACAQNAQWQAMGLRPVTITVNLSARQLRDEEFPERVQRALAQTGLAADWLELELTESALMDNAEAARKTLAALTGAGVKVSIDDFGTGYSSLAYLRDFSFSTLKIDRSFLNDIGGDRKASSVVMGLIALAHSLRLTVTAEGVETDCQLAFLRRQQCDHVQGYLVSRPVTAEQLTDLLRMEYGLPATICPATATATTGLSVAPATPGPDAAIDDRPSSDSLVAQLSSLSSTVSSPASSAP